MKTELDKFTNEELTFRDAFFLLDKTIKLMTNNFLEYLVYFEAEKELCINLAKQIDNNDSDMFIRLTERSILHSMNKKSYHFEMYSENRNKRNHYQQMMGRLNEKK